MGSLSNAIGDERRSNVSGITVRKGFYSNETGNLPQIIAVFGEANTANQGSFTTAPYEFTNSNEVGEKYGYGSPLHQMARILRPKSGEGVGGIPTFIFPQISDSVSATATQITVSITGTATKNATHSLIINGRTGIDAQNYSFSVVIGDTPAVIHQKMRDAVTAVISSPVLAAGVLSNTVFTSKWAGLTSSELNISFDVNGNNAGVTYAVTNKTNGAGDVNLADSFALFGNTHYTCVINPYTTKLADYEAFNGVPGDTPTGRYSANLFKPFHAFTGNTSSDKTVLAGITDNASRVEQVTNVICPATNSAGFTWEAATNVVYRFARKMQDEPHNDVNSLSYPDMPAPTNGTIGDMADYNNRDLLVKKGCSTVIFENGLYKIMDLVTTYHPTSDPDFVFSYPRNNNLFWNIKEGYMTLQNIFLQNKTVVADNQVVTVGNCIKAKEWKAVVNSYFDELAQEGKITDPEFSKASLQVAAIPSLNRFETFFRVKITSIARVTSATFEVNY